MISIEHSMNIKGGRGVNFDKRFRLNHHINLKISQLTKAPRSIHLLHTIVPNSTPIFYTPIFMHSLYISFKNGTNGTKTLLETSVKPLDKYSPAPKFHQGPFSMTSNSLEVNSETNEWSFFSP